MSKEHLIPWKPGQSGNPNGRPKGRKNYNGLKNASAAELLNKNSALLIAKVIEKALEGNEACLKMCMDRLLPSQRAIDITKVEKQQQDIKIYVEKVEDKALIEHKKAEIIDIAPIREKELAHG